MVTTSVSSGRNVTLNLEVLSTKRACRDRRGELEHVAWPERRSCVEVHRRRQPDLHRFLPEVADFTGARSLLEDLEEELLIQARQLAFECRAE